MTTIILSIYILLDIIYYMIFLHIILSWLTIFGLIIRIKFIDDIIGPMYKFVKKYIPTGIGPFDFTPIIILFIIIFIRGLLMGLFPEVPNSILDILG